MSVSKDILRVFFSSALRFLSEDDTHTHDVFYDCCALTLFISASRSRSRFFLPSEPGGLPRRFALVVVELNGTTLILEVSPAAETVVVPLIRGGRVLPRLTSPAPPSAAAAAVVRGMLFWLADPSSLSFCISAAADQAQ